MAQQKKQLHYLCIWTGPLSLMCTGGKDENNKREMLKVGEDEGRRGRMRSRWDLGEPPGCIMALSVSANGLNDFAALKGNIDPKSCEKGGTSVKTYSPCAAVW